MKYFINTVGRLKPPMKFKRRMALVIVTGTALMFSSCAAAGNRLAAVFESSAAESQNEVIAGNWQESFVSREIEPSDNLVLLPETISVEGNPFDQTTTLESEKTVTIADEKQLLEPIQTTNINFLGYCYDEYRDDNGDIYGFYSGTNIFCSYQRNIDTIILGNTDVNTESALKTAAEFLNNLSYDVSGFKIDHSNEYSRDFSVTYQYYYGEIPTGEKIIVHMMADETGTANITSFRAYDYGRYSKDNDFIDGNIDSLYFLNERNKALSQNFPDGQPEITSHFWKDKNDKLCLRTLAVTDGKSEYFYTY